MQTQRTLPAALLLIGLMSGFGCTSAGSVDSSATLSEAMRHGPVATDPLFWRVEPAGGATLYMLGSVHFGPPQGWTFPPAVERAWAESQTLIVEVDDRNVSEASMALLAQRFMMIPEGATLEDLVPSETQRDLALHLERRSGDIGGLMRMRPWLIATMISLEPIAELGFSTESGVDRSYLLGAGEREIIELESIESQLQIFGELPPELEARLLQDTLDRFDENEATFLAMAEAWQRGDEHALETLVAEAFGDAAEFDFLNRAILVDRNTAMAQRLDRVARDPARAGKTAFVVVGAAHFVGNDSIRRILEREHGIRIEQIGPAVPPTPHSGTSDAH